MKSFCWHKSVKRRLTATFAIFGQKNGSSTICDKSLQKIIKTERRNWKRLSLHLASNTQKSLKWTGWTQWTQWTFCVIRKIKSSIWSIWSIWSIKCWFVSRQIKQAYGFKESEYFKLKIYHLPEISSEKSIRVSVTNRRWGVNIPSVMKYYKLSFFIFTSYERSECFIFGVKRKMLHSRMKWLAAA